MADIIESIQSTLLQDFYGIPVWFMIVIVVFAFIFILLLRGRKKEEEYKYIEPEKEIQEEFKVILNTTGQKVKYKALLMFSMLPIGRIVNWSPYRYEKTIDLKKNAKMNHEIEKLRKEVKGIEYQEDNFALLKVVNANPIRYVIWLLTGNLFNIGNERYFLVDREFIQKQEGTNVYLNMNAQPMQFYKTIYIFSMEGEKVIQGMVNNLTTKQVLRETVNFIPAMHFYDFKTGRFVAKAEAIRKIKKKTWKDKEESLEKEVEDSEGNE